MSKILKNSKVLIVDDMKINILSVEKILKAHHFECYSETDSAKVLDVAKAISPSVILLDFEMPGLSGTDVCKLLKADSKTQDIPVLFVTSHTGEAELAAAFEAGADDYVFKPAREKELLARLKRVHLNRELQTQLHNQFEDQTMLTRILSHDINNILTMAIFGINGLAKLTPPPGSENYDLFVRHLTKTKDAFNRVVSLVKNVRELQSLDDNKQDLKLEPVDISKIFNDCQAVFADKLTQKNLTLKISCTANIFVMADQNSLAASVINNIISNAIKFSNMGSSIEITAQKNGENIFVEIQDHGIGMNQDLLSKVFSKTEKTSRDGTLKEKGTGFGMPIIKKYMEIYGGSIAISSKSVDEFPVNSGTCVSLAFKAAEPKQAAA